MNRSVKPGFEGHVHQCVCRGYTQPLGGLMFNVFEPHVSNFLYNDDPLEVACSVVAVFQS